LESIQLKCFHKRDKRFAKEIKEQLEKKVNSIPGRPVVLDSVELRNICTSKEDSDKNRRASG